MDGGGVPKERPRVRDNLRPELEAASTVTASNPEDGYGLLVDLDNGYDFSERWPRIL